MHVFLCLSYQSSALIKKKHLKRIEQLDKVVIVRILVFSEKWEVLIVHLHASDVQWFPGSNSRKVLFNSENQSGRKDFLLLSLPVASLQKRQTSNSCVVAASHIGIATIYIWSVALIWTEAKVSELDVMPNLYLQSIC